MGDASSGNGIGQGRRDVVLPDDLLKAPWTPFTCGYLIVHVVSITVEMGRPHPLYGYS